MIARNLLYDTHPIIHHCPLDVPGFLWNRLVRMKGHCPESLDKPDDLTIITFNNTGHPMLLENRLLASATDYVLLGANVENWRNPLKIDLLVEFLPSVSTPYVLVLDAIDVVITSKLSNLIERFGKFNCKMLFNSSSAIYPWEPTYSSEEKRICRSIFCHLNSGCFIAETDYCLQIYSEASKFSDEVTTEFHYSDQIKLKAMYLKYYPDIKIDYRSDIFQVWNYSRDVVDLCCKFI